MENQKKKSLKGLWIALALIVVAGIAVWCGYNASISDKGVASVFGLSSLLTGCIYKGIDEIIFRSYYGKGK